MGPLHTITGRCTMARILIVTNGTGTLQTSVLAFRLAGHRVTLRDAVTPFTVQRIAPDLLVIGPGDAEAAHTLVDTLRAEAALRFLPVIVAGVVGDLHALLPPVAPAADTVVLPAPLDAAVLFDAAHLFVTAVGESRHVA